MVIKRVDYPDDHKSFSALTENRKVFPANNYSQMTSIPIHIKRELKPASQCKYMDIIPNRTSFIETIRSSCNAISPKVKYQTDYRLKRHSFDGSTASAFQHSGSFNQQIGLHTLNAVNSEVGVSQDFLAMQPRRSSLNVPASSTGLELLLNKSHKTNNKNQKRSQNNLNNRKSAGYAKWKSPIEIPLKVVKSRDSLVAIVKSTDMDDKRISQSIRIVVSLIQQNKSQGFMMIARQIKLTHDQTFGGYWHCIVGKHFSAFVTHDTNTFAYINYDPLSILLFKSM
ncbi:hypothetical protein GJ496_001407 [Pomphorhynchus laevis]|nr:hypothetical protein GJ496_001407 [Pomphorhynchus laevis]